MAKKPPKDKDALLDEVTELEELVKRRKKAQRDLRALEDEEEGGEPLEPALPGAELVDQVINTLGGDGSFSVTKLDGSKVVDCGNYDLTLWPDAMQGIIEKNGGGNYVLVFHGQDGRIAKRIKRTYPGAPAQAPAPMGGSGDMLSMLKIMEERDARREAQNETLRLEAMKGQQAMMTAMMGMMGAQNKPMVNNAAELVSIAELFKSKDKGTDLGQLRDLMELLEDLRGGEREGDAPTIQTDNPLVALLAPIAAALSKGLTAQKLAPVRPSAPAAAPVAARAPLPVPAAPPSPAPTAVSSPASEESGLLEHAPMLKAAIDAGATPELSASKAWEDAIAKSQEEDLIDLIEAGDWKTLCEHPDLKAHAPWLESFRDELRARIPKPTPDLKEKEPEPESSNAIQ